MSNYSSDNKNVSRETNHIVYQVYEDLSESPLTYLLFGA